VDPNNAAHATGYAVGVIFGAIFIGILCGLIPLKVCQQRGRSGLGWLGFGLCLVSGFLFGLLGALPMAGVMSLVGVIVPSAAKKSGRSKQGLKPRPPVPQSYDL
jgi:hypothetical protein